MKSILHFSDLHFGARQAPNWARALLEEIDRREPDIVAISGDLTQRARSEQFRQAREFLDRINAPLIVVPGNHDVPLWNVFARFHSPLGMYKRWITRDTNPIFHDDQIAIMGLDSTRSFTIKGGRIGGEALRIARERLSRLPGGLCKVIVTHHPLALPPGFERERAVGGFKRALEVFEECGVELILTGHLHQAYFANARSELLHPRSSMLLVQAGTAASLRGRGSEHMKNSLNLIEISELEITATSYLYSEREDCFIPGLKHSSPRLSRH